MNVHARSPLMCAVRCAGCRKHLSQLFALAGESSRAVQGLAENSSAFWKSAHTQQVIAQEEALKRHLFLQMLNAAPVA